MLTQVIAEMSGIVFVSQCILANLAPYCGLAKGDEQYNNFAVTAALRPIVKLL